MEVKYLIGNEVYIDFNTVMKQLGRVRSVVYNLLKKSELQTTQYKNLKLFKESEIAELLKTQTKK